MKHECRFGDDCNIKLDANGIHCYPEVQIVKERVPRHPLPDQDVIDLIEVERDNREEED